MARQDEDIRFTQQLISVCVGEPSRNFDSTGQVTSPDLGSEPANLAAASHDEAPGAVAQLARSQRIEQLGHALAIIEMTNEQDFERLVTVAMDLEAARIGHSILHDQHTPWVASHTIADYCKSTAAQYEHHEGSLEHACDAILHRRMSMRKVAVIVEIVQVNDCWQVDMGCHFA